ncbi:MAG TPA: response regulator [Steroidobacteraceae bacterium]|nr:response regulator [Steroidobacteraceae bacterium]
MTRILTVDDSASMRNLVKLALLDAGFDVAQANDGREALDMALASSYDLVLADVNMPNMDGIELIRALRSDGGYRMTPILMLTTVTSPTQRAEGKAAGATGWIVKPFHPEQLVAAIRRALR